MANQVGTRTVMLYVQDVPLDVPGAAVADQAGVALSEWVVSYLPPREKA